MATRSVATVFGGAGFIGRYVVKRLAAAGHVVRVVERDPERAAFLRTMGAVGQIVPLHASVRDAASVARAVDGADLLVNLVGLLAERRPGDFQAVHGDGPARLAVAATSAGVRRFVHVSAIGADRASDSLYASSKAAGETGARAAFPSVTVLRPSLVFGPEDQFFNRFAAMAGVLPFLPVISGGTKFQPVYVGDVADAVMAALTRPDTSAATFELGGPRVWTFRELMAWILLEIGKKRPLIEVPASLAQLQARVFERLPGKLLTQDQLKLLARDNVVAPGARGLADLGIEPTPVDVVVPTYLARFRTGGAQARYDVIPS